MITVKMFGPFTITDPSGVQHHQVENTQNTAHGKWVKLLAYLILNNGTPISKEQITKDVWGDDYTVGNTEKAITSMKKTVFVGEGQRWEEPLRSIGIRLHELDVDLVLLDNALEDAPPEFHTLCAALDRCQRPLLVGWEDAWVQEARRRYAAKVHMALKQVVQMACGRKEFALAADYLLRLRNQGDLAPELHETVMRACLQEQAYVRAHQLYLDFSKELKKERNLLPPPPMQGLFHSIPNLSAVFEAPVEREWLEIESVGGAMPIQSPFYCVRDADKIFHTAIARRESIILIKGASQVGKSSLLFRGVYQGLQAGIRIIVTDFQSLNTDAIYSMTTLYQALMSQLYDKFTPATTPEEHWKERRTPNQNFSTYLENVILSPDAPSVIWFMDGIDRLFEKPYRNDVFGLFRSWHNARSVPSDNPWRKFTLVMSYSTEAQMLITNIDQSPFTVGVKVELTDFSSEHLAALCHTHNISLGSDDHKALMRLTGGHPYLVRLCLYEHAVNGRTIRQIVDEAKNDRGLFHSHLGRVYANVASDPTLYAALVALLQRSAAIDVDAFQRLQAGGIVTGTEASKARLRCDLYEIFFRRHLL